MLRLICVQQLWSQSYLKYTHTPTIMLKVCFSLCVCECVCLSVYGRLSVGVCSSMSVYMWVRVGVWLAVYDYFWVYWKSECLFGTPCEFVWVWLVVCVAIRVFVTLSVYMLWECVWITICVLVWLCMDVCLCVGDCWLSTFRDRDPVSLSNWISVDLRIRTFLDTSRSLQMKIFKIIQACKNIFYCAIQALTHCPQCATPAS